LIVGLLSEAGSGRLLLCWSLGEPVWEFGWSKLKYRKRFPRPNLRTGAERIAH
jgi:hypothetical protein